MTEPSRLVLLLAVAACAVAKR
ncbi:MAG TPA: hypothetical protein DHU96_13790 [Actinobacteria bacterium]|nr:hypothetical protein [Actinomycetota bacterium]